MIGNSFSVLRDEEGEVDVTKLASKIEEESSREEENRSEKSCSSVRVRLPRRTQQDGTWQVNERQRSDTAKEEKKAAVAAAVEECDEEEYVSEDGVLLVEEITKGKQRMRRMLTKRKKKETAYRAFKGYDRH